MVLAVVPWNRWCSVSYGPDVVIESLKLPVVKIVVTVDNNFDTCRNEEECAERMREIQAFYQTHWSCPNIPYNFIIGNDGNVYEGRGWHEKPFKSRTQDDLHDCTIDIAVIGQEEPERHAAFDMLPQFVNQFIEMNKIHKVYTCQSYHIDKKLF